MPETHYFHDENALLERLFTGLRKRGQEIVFLVGSPLSAPFSPGLPGVPGVDGVVNLIRSEFATDATQLTMLDGALHRAGPNRYQEAFLFLQGRRGQQTANEIIREAVLMAWTGSPQIINAQTHPDDACRTMELDFQRWHLPAGIEALGKLIAGYGPCFGRATLTTNFDPLLEISIRRAGGNYFRTTLHADGNLSQTEGTGCHVIHLHGYWYGSDTLHTPRQLSQPRPRLRASLSALLRNKLVIVCGYGGGDDAFAEALLEVVADDTAYPEILWTFYPSQPRISDALSTRLAAGIDRGRVVLYSGIDCNHFFPALYNLWSAAEPPKELAQGTRSNPVSVTKSLADAVNARPVIQTTLEGDDEDRPPVIEICVGREQDLQIIKTSPAKIIFLTGLGGQGKSTLAAQYYSECQQNPAIFSLLVWRDCKEEGERFELQLAAIIEQLSGGTINGPDLAHQSTESVVNILLAQIQEMTGLFVFDNVDHYVDIDHKRMIGSADIFITALLNSSARARVIFTCRPSVEYSVKLALSIRLGGIDIEAARSLFSARKANSTPADIEAAQRLTDGHAFWLDLLAVQVAKGTPGRDLNTLLSEIHAGGGPLPAATLNSIWSTLKDREQAVLRLMAETVKPESDVTIADYLSGVFTFNKVAKALRVLRSLNLIVIKRRNKGPDLLELHPLVRAFIQRSFVKEDRGSYINRIIRVYQKSITAFKPRLTQRPSLSMLQYWTQNAELEFAIGNINDAFGMLAEVASSFTTSAYPREFIRVTRPILANLGWVEEHGQIEHFELVFKSHIWILSHLGEIKELELLLDAYERTVPTRDARYINYCDLRCYAFWFSGAFSDAVEWGRRGQKLLEDSSVDSKHSRGITHTLALAERDAGRPESALPVFLDGRLLSDVIDPDELDEARGEHHYGNIGRCLHFMGQIESALVCYQKSALLLEKNEQSENFTNKGYARTWIGELLASRGELALAYTFLQSAVRLWEQIAPPKAGAVSALMKDIEIRAGRSLRVKESEVERVCLAWILGGNT